MTATVTLNRSERNVDPEVTDFVKETILHCNTLGR